MKHFLILPFILCSVSCFAQFSRDIELTAPTFFYTATNDSLAPKIEPKVYIHESSKANTYHLLDTCQLVKRSKKTLLAVSEEAAKERFRRTLCTKCAK